MPKRLRSSGLSDSHHTASDSVSCVPVIATDTGGTYSSAATQTELAQTYETIGTLERSRVGERRFTQFLEFAPWLAGLALALLVAEAALRATALRRYP